MPLSLNAAIVHGLSHEVGSVEVGKLADLVLWNPAFFGLKPDMGVKGGAIVYAMMGDPNASIPTPQPVHGRMMFGGYGGALTHTSLTFVSNAALEDDIGHKLGLRKRLSAVLNTRGGIGKPSMIHKNAMLHIEVDAETYEVRADGVLLTCKSAAILPMAQRYFLF